MIVRCFCCTLTAVGVVFQLTVEWGNHKCPAANCWMCPVCGDLCPSASAAQKHLDSHNGIKAFVCNICQYKGNTLRGLRTHIRMHFNKRLIPELMVSVRAFSCT